MSSGNFEQMVCAEYRQVYGFAWHLTRDEHIAVDLTQETFRIAWEKWHSFAGNSSVATWLHQIVYRKFIDQRRSGKTRKRVQDQVTQQYIFEHRDNNRQSEAKHVLLVESRADILTAVDQLGDADRLVVILRYLQELSVAETAAITGMPAGTIKWRANNALEKLRKLLATER